MLLAVVAILLITPSVEGQAPHFHHGVPVGTVTSHSITEASGIAASRKHHNVLYTHNDSGGQNRIFAIDATNGHRLATIYINGAHSHDWEDIAVGPCPDSGSCIYIGDTGGNAGGESNKIYRVHEPSTIRDQTIQLESTLHFSWDQHDCETLMVDPSAEVYVVSKNRNGHGKLVHLPKYAWGTGRTEYVSGGTYLPIHTPDYDPVGGDISVTGHSILIKTYRKVYFWHILDGNYLQHMASPPMELPYNGERQGEAVCWDANGSGYYTLGEGAYSKLYYYRRY